MKYERLTKKGGLNFADPNLSLVDEWGYSHIYKRLAEYEDDEESGKTVRLPCKVGDTVYVIHQDWDEDGKDFYYIDDDKFSFYLFDWWGVTVFLTREEAEAKLKELQE